MAFPAQKNVCIVVLGDVGRSPRMQYHSLSLAEAGHIVDIVGYGETEPMEEIKRAPLIFYHYMVPCPVIPFRLLNYVFKTIWQAISLLAMLLFIRRPDYLLVQNPPAVPTLVVCWIVAIITRAKLVIDWHNYAHTIMALSVGKSNKLVKITRKIESFIGKKAAFSFCVTKAMKEDLKNYFEVNALTLYDRPPARFRSISLEEKHEFLLELGKDYPELLEDGSTKFSCKKDAEYLLKTSRPALLVSSTSWTQDEDFGVLFKALENYELQHDTKNLPKLICIITGKGPMKEHYCKLIRQSNWKFVTVITPWLKPEDYPLVLASADLGVCLHTSSSGLDLPMKVVDMFGCGLPVCAFDFKCLGELVQHDKNGFVFSNSEELASQLITWFENFPNNQRQIEKEISFKQNLQTFQNLRWSENWNLIARPLFK